MANDMQMTNERLVSLDVLRGLDMIILTVIGPLLFAVHEIWGLPDIVFYHLNHPWEGFSFWDIIMPLFIFSCGAAVPFALERRLARTNGRPTASYWRHVFGRFALLWFLGMVVQGRLCSLDILEVRPFNNTLESIAVGYLACAVAVCIPSWRFRIAFPIVCFVLYGVLLHFLGDYSMTGNFAEKVEQTILTAVMPAGSKAIREVDCLGYVPDIYARGEIHYTWWLTSLMFVFMSFTGYFATKILQSNVPPKVRAARLLVYAAVLLTVGFGLQLCGVRLVKHIFTVSFTAQAMGWCSLAYAVLYYLTDVRGFRCGLWLPLLFGQFALTAYLMEDLFKGGTLKIAERFLHGVPHLLGTNRYQPLVMALFAVGVMIAVLAIRRRLRQSRKR